VLDARLRLSVMNDARAVFAMREGGSAESESGGKMATPAKRTRAERNIPLRDWTKVLDLYTACMKHVHELIEDAELLLTNARYARALFFALTASEEFGKAQLVADFFNDCVSPEEFWRGFRSHSLKLAYVRRLVELPGATIVYDEERVRSLRDLRDAALYVSVGDDYAAVTPNSQITPEQATDAVRSWRRW